MAAPGIILPTPSTSSKSPNFRAADFAHQIGATTSPVSVTVPPYPRSLSPGGDQTNIRPGIALGIATPASFPSSTFTGLAAADIVPTAAPTPPATTTALGITPPAPINISNSPVLQGSDLMQKVGSATLPETVIVIRPGQPFAEALHPRLSAVPFVTIEAMVPQQLVVRVGP